MIDTIILCGISESGDAAIRLQGMFYLHINFQHIFYTSLYDFFHKDVRPIKRQINKMCCLKNSFALVY